MSTLVISDYNKDSIPLDVLSVLCAAKNLMKNLMWHLLGIFLTKVKFEILIAPLIKVFLCKANDSQLTAETICSSLKDLIKNYDNILTASNTFGKNFMPRLSA